MIFGRPPLLASDQLKASVGAASAVWARLLVEVAYNPNADPTCKREVLEEYEKSWKPFITAYSDDSVLAPQVADESEINGLIGRTNGLAKSCLKGFSAANQVRGIDAEEEHPIAATINREAPGGPPPSDGSLLKPSTKIALVFVGGVLVLAGSAMYVTGKVEKMLLKGI